jgi:hypothetical protein
MLSKRHKRLIFSGGPDSVIKGGQSLFNKNKTKTFLHKQLNTPGKNELKKLRMIYNSRIEDKLTFSYTFSRCTQSNITH